MIANRPYYDVKPLNYYPLILLKVRRWKVWNKHWMLSIRNRLEVQSLKP